MTVQSIQVGFLHTNCYLLMDETSKLAAVIDPGDGGDQIASMLQEMGMELSLILLTHGHVDHVSGVADLLSHYPQAQVYLGKEDFGGPNHDQRMYPAWSLIEEGGPWTEVNWYLEADPPLTLGELTIQVMKTPGHSPGSVTLLCEDAMFSGDTLFAGTCGRCDLEGGDMEQMMVSLRALGQLEGDYTVYPGHGDASTLSEERRSNPYMRRAMSR